MEITEKKLKRAVLFEVQGRIDHGSAPDLDKKLIEALKNGHYRLAIDMSGVDYISSAGIRALIAARKQARRWNRGDVRLAGLQPRIVEVFDLVGISPLFEHFDSPVDAVGSF